MSRHSFLVEIDEEVKKVLEVQAKDNMRSMRKEVEFILKQAAMSSPLWMKEEKQSAQEEISL